MGGIDPYDPNNPDNARARAEWEAENPRHDSSPGSWKGDLLVAAIVIGFLLVYAGMSRLFSIPTVRHGLGTYWSRALLSLVVIAAGFVAFRFKNANQILYGRVEVAFGMASCLNVALRSPIESSLLAQWSALIGSAYVVSRGLNNISDARSRAQMKTP